MVHDKESEFWCYLGTLQHRLHEDSVSLSDYGILSHSANFELLKFEKWTSVKIIISRFSGHNCPGNEGVFDMSYREAFIFLKYTHYGQ